MKKCFTLQILIFLFAITLNSVAQDASPFTFNIGGGPGFPRGGVGSVSDTGGNFVVGGGKNIGQTIGFDGEFYWNGLPPKPSVVAQTGAPGGTANLYSINGNILLHTHEAHHAGLYAIGGIGWYHRNWALTAPTLSLGTVCLPTYVWWGVTCTNGLVSSTAILRSGSSDGFGWNGGIGITYRIGDSHVKVYTEARYHYAYHSQANTEVLPLTFGFRW